MTDRARDALLRAGIFAAALLPRAVLAYVTLGAVDAIHDFRNSVRIIEGLPAVNPYLPNYDLWIWLGGKLAYFTALPPTFSYKLLPVVADALIALLLFDAEPERRAGLRHGLLYAIAPAPIYMVAIHQAWDSICLYFLLIALVMLRARRDGAAGAAWVVSNIFKPLSAPLALLLVTPSVSEGPGGAGGAPTPPIRTPHPPSPLALARGDILAFVAGAAAAVVAYLVLLVAIGRPLTIEDVRIVVQYASGGVQLFGLPIRAHNRIWIVVPLTLVVTALAWTKRITRDEGVLLFFAATVGLSGLSANYLCWIVPFALLCRRNVFLAIYTAASGVFLVILYRSPVLNLTNLDNMGAYAMLKPFGGWTPTLAGEAWQQTIRLLGNIVIPLLCLTYVALRVMRVVVRKETHADPVSPPRAWVPVIAFVIFVAALLVWAAAKPPLQSVPFIAKIERKIAAYDVVRYRGPGLMTAGKTWFGRAIVDPSASNPILNLSNAGLLWVAAASAATALWRDS